ncbi:MAG: hypothetical protein AXW12_17680 [Thalassospira sp. Nap_22]|nr:MAG: hypothetical protein AXW12_17680 [Thalassospira sp. Nap_22]
MNLIRNWIQTADTRLREFDKKHHLFLGTPSWLVGVFLVMLLSGAACVTLSALFPFGASTAIFIVGAFAFLASFAIGWSFSIYRTRYIHLNGNNTRYELLYFGKVVGEIDSRDVAGIDLALIKSPQKWLREGLFSLSVLWSYFGRLPALVIKFLLVFGLALFLFFDVPLETLTEKQGMMKLFEISFACALLAWAIAAMLGFYQTAIRVDLPRTRNIMAAAGVTGYDPKDIEMLPKPIITSASSLETEPA